MEIKPNACTRCTKLLAFNPTIIYNENRDYPSRFCFGNNIGVVKS